MAQLPAAALPELLSVIVPTFNEVESVERLALEIEQVIPPLRRPMPHPLPHLCPSRRIVARTKH